ncbi:hypothetical protein BU15DRAFT_66684 [Melanogaster broomeanus]|nr:hypothetical protein BU15DRAFT_66684 [Melanogaster broomeanus]
MVRNLSYIPSEGQFDLFWSWQPTQLLFGEDPEGPRSPTSQIGKCPIGTSNTAFALQNFSRVEKQPSVRCGNTSTCQEPDEAEKLPATPSPNFYTSKPTTTMPSFPLQDSIRASQRALRTQHLLPLPNLPTSSSCITALRPSLVSESSKGFLGELIRSFEPQRDRGTQEEASEASEVGQESRFGRVWEELYSWQEKDERSEGVMIEVNQSKSANNACWSSGRIQCFRLVRGGGTSGQSGALALAIAMGCVAHVPEVEPNFEESQVIEERSSYGRGKKPGLAKARKAYTWVKR